MKRCAATSLAAAVAVGLAACASGPTPPDWQFAAQGAMRRAIEADLSGDSRAAMQEYQRARAETARTGRPDLVARAELMRCAARTAALDFARCEAFDALRADSGEPERAYADHLQGTLDAARVPLLPAAQQPLAAAGRGDAADAALLQATADPLSRLLGAALWLRQGRAGDAVVAVAVDTASAQGWRRPLLAWLAVQKQRAEQRGDAAEAARIGRRIELVAPAR